MTPEQRLAVLATLERVLPFRECQILLLRWGIDDGHCFTLEECGRIFGISRERVRQLQAQAVARLEKDAEWRNLVASIPAGSILR